MKLKIRNKRVFNFYLLQLLGWGLVFVFHALFFSSPKLIPQLSNEFSFFVYLIVFCLIGFIITLGLRLFIKRFQILKKSTQGIVITLVIVSLIATSLWILTNHLLVSLLTWSYDCKFNNLHDFIFCSDLTICVMFIWIGLYVMIKKQMEYKKLYLEKTRLLNNIKIINNNFALSKQNPYLILSTLKTILSTINIDLVKAKDFIIMLNGYIHKSNKEKFVNNGFKQILSYMKIFEIYFAGRLNYKINPVIALNEKLFLIIPFCITIERIIHFALINNFQIINININLTNELDKLFISFSLEVNKITKLALFKDFLKKDFAQLNSFANVNNFEYEVKSENNYFSIIFIPNII